MTEDFNKWWNADRLIENNPYEQDTPAFWAWEGWQAALANPDETVTFGLSTCLRCGKANPAEIHTCTPKPEPEPVAWMHIQGNHEEPSWRKLNDDEISRGWAQKPLYTAPPQREWQGLTDEEAEQIVDLYWNDPSMFIEAIETKLKEKNT